MEQLLAHLVGDYILQSHWAAENKTKSHLAAAVHAVTYSLPFLLLGPSAWAFATILITHFFIDRYRLARYVVWFKNGFCLDAKELPKLWWSNCRATGYPSEVPLWLSVWLLIITDNTLHLLINYASLRWL